MRVAEWISKRQAPRVALRSVTMLWRETRRMRGLIRRLPVRALRESRSVQCRRPDRIVVVLRSLRWLWCAFPGDLIPGPNEPLLERQTTAVASARKLS